MKPFGLMFVLAALSLSAAAATAQTDSRVAVSGSVGAAIRVRPRTGLRLPEGRMHG